jgi:alpha-L-fucosidase
VDAEGPTRVVSKLWTFKEEGADWTTADFRFTRKGRNVYAFQMAYPARRIAFIRSLGLTRRAIVRAVSVLGAPSPVTFRQYEDGLLVELPEQKVCDPIPCIKAELTAG